jgi:transcriptional regulator with XRE-family HTH domain
MPLQFTPRPSRHTPKFPNAIRRCRIQRGLSQHALAMQLGLHRSLVSLWERGLRLPSVPSLLSMARELGVLPDTLYPDLSFAASLRKRALVPAAS